MEGNNMNTNNNDMEHNDMEHNDMKPDDKGNNVDNINNTNNINTGGGIRRGIEEVNAEFSEAIDKFMPAEKLAKPVVVTITLSFERDAGGRNYVVAFRTAFNAMLRANPDGWKPADSPRKRSFYVSPPSEPHFNGSAYDPCLWRLAAAIASTPCLPPRGNRQGEAVRYAQAWFAVIESSLRTLLDDATPDYPILDGYGQAFSQVFCGRIRARVHVQEAGMSSPSPLEAFVYDVQNGKSEGPLRPDWSKTLPFPIGLNGTIAMAPVSPTGLGKSRGLHPAVSTSFAIRADSIKTETDGLGFTVYADLEAPRSDGWTLMRKGQPAQWEWGKPGGESSPKQRAEMGLPDTGEFEEEEEEEDGPEWRRLVNGRYEPFKPAKHYRQYEQYGYRTYSREPEAVSTAGEAMEFFDRHLPRIDRLFRIEHTAQAETIRAELTRAFGRTFVTYTTKDKRCFWYSQAPTGDTPRCLMVGHIDCVAPPPRTFAVDRHAAKCWGSAVDDRAGIGMILTAVRSGEYGTVDVLIATDEEQGRTTAENFTATVLADRSKFPTWTHIAEFDRQGGNSTVYQYRSPRWARMIESAGISLVSGSFSDISRMDGLGISAINLATGYGDGHSADGTWCLRMARDMMLKYKQLQVAIGAEIIEHEHRDNTSWGKGL